MRLLAILAVAGGAVALWPAAANAASPPTTRCAQIVAKRESQDVAARAVMATGVSCRTAHAVARAYLEHSYDDPQPSRYRGYACDLVSDGVIGCDRGRREVQFDVVPVEGTAVPGSCGDATLFRTSRGRARATSIQRSRRVSCGFATNLIRAAYGRGPLRVVSRKGAVSVLAGGWRCRTGASGAACWNAERGSLNVLPPIRSRQRLAVTADAP